MPAEFQIVNERVVITRYSEPVQVSDIERMTHEVDVYAEQAPQPILAIADFAEVNHFPSTLITMGLRQNSSNPVRNPKIETLMAIADSAFLTNVISVVARITRSKKMVIVRTREVADKEIEAFMKKGEPE